MTGTEIVANPLRYNGFTNSYVDVAVRGTEALGIGIEYAVHPKDKAGYFIVRFVVHGKQSDFLDYTHLTLRERANFRTAGDHAEFIKGYRLNKVLIKAFEPGPGKFELDTYATKFGSWVALEAWVRQQVEAEGFTINVDLLKELRKSLVPEPIQAEVTNVLTFPDLTVEKKAAKPLKLVSKSTPDDEDEDEDPDADDDKDDDDEPWLN